MSRRAALERLAAAARADAAVRAAEAERRKAEKRGETPPPKVKELIDGPTPEQRAKQRYEQVRSPVRAHAKAEVWRRQTQARTLYNRGFLDKRLFEAVDWYRGEAEATGSGVKSCLDVGTGRSAPGTRGPTMAAVRAVLAAEYVREARSEVVSGVEHAADAALFDRIALYDWTYERAGREFFPGYAGAVAARHARDAFKKAAEVLADWHDRAVAPVGRPL